MHSSGPWGLAWIATTTAHGIVAQHHNTQCVACEPKLHSLASAHVGVARGRRHCCGRWCGRRLRRWRSAQPGSPSRSGARRSAPPGCAGSRSRWGTGTRPAMPAPAAPPPLASAQSNGHLVGGKPDRLPIQANDASLFCLLRLEMPEQCAAVDDVTAKCMTAKQDRQVQQSIMRQRRHCQASSQHAGIWRQLHADIRSAPANTPSAGSRPRWPARPAWAR